MYIMYYVTIIFVFNLHNYYIYNCILGIDNLISPEHKQVFINIDNKINRYIHKSSIII